MLNENLQKIRTERNFTKEELSKKSGVHRNTIKLIENSCSKNPAITTLEKLAKALDVTVNDLIK